jgi:uncharacterized protein
MNQFGGIIFLISLFLLSSFLNWYVFQAVKTLFSAFDGDRVKQILTVCYWLLFQGITIWVLIMLGRFVLSGGGLSSIQSVFDIFLTVLVTQVVCVLVLLGEDIFRNIQAGFYFLKDYANGFSFQNRAVWVSALAVTIAAVPFFSFVFGMTYGKYNFKVHREVVYFDALPEAFNGFTIVQLSDIHAGSFTNYKAVQKGIDLANAQQADLFVFTGDLVNHKADEIEPMLEQFGQIKAKYGQFSILGNHDYGDYISWPSKEAKEDNFKKLKAQHQRMGYRLLLDEHVSIKKDGQTIHVLGVENWGVGFKAKGDLEKALEGLSSDDFKILLSHDPSHWDVEVKNHPNPIHLTLSGHTHGMQMGIETPVIRWSPVQYRYPNWAGLYEEVNRYLYVNRGFGFHAFSGRVGIWPEITVIELRKKNN